MRVVRNVALVVAAAIGALLVYAATRPGELRVERAARVRAPADSPYEGHNVAEFTLAPEGDGTRVTWAMHGPTRYITKLIGVFVSMDRMIGTDFETGLANLKAIAESGRE